MPHGAVAGTASLVPYVPNCWVIASYRCLSGAWILGNRHKEYPISDTLYAIASFSFAGSLAFDYQNLDIFDLAVAWT